MSILKMIHFVTARELNKPCFVINYCIYSQNSSFCTKILKKQEEIGDSGVIC